MRLPHVVVAASAALLLAACGGSDDSTGGTAADSSASSSSSAASPLDGLTGSEVAAAAADALEAAGAVHAAGTMEQGGQSSDIDLQLQGEDVAGTITLAGNELELIAVAGTKYARATADFWAMSGVPEVVATSLDGRWVVLPADASDLGDLSLTGIIDSLRNPDSPVADEVSQDQLAGQDVVVVTQDDGSTLYVADGDPAYPLQLTNEGDTSGTVTFSGFGEQQDIAAPAGAIDLEALAGGN